MRRLMLAAALSFALPSLGAAAPCIPASLDTYIALGGGGCSADGATVFDFSASVLDPFATPIPAADILVTPLAGGKGVQFGVDVDAGPGEFFDILIGYSLSGPTFLANSLSMSGSSAEPAPSFFDTGGVVTVVEDKCIGGTFAGGDPFAPCSGTPATLIVVHDPFGAFPVDGTTFPPASFFDVFTEIAIDGGTGGFASLHGTVTNQFGVPEPSAFLLVGSGVLGMYARRRRRRMLHCSA